MTRFFFYLNRFYFDSALLDFRCSPNTLIFCKFWFPFCFQFVFYILYQHILFLSLIYFHSWFSIKWKKLSVVGTLTNCKEFFHCAPKTVINTQIVVVWCGSNNFEDKERQSAKDHTKSSLFSKNTSVRNVTRTTTR